MKKKIIISILIFALALLALNISNSPARAEDPCFDGMCSIEVNITTGKTTYTRLSDAEIAIRLAAKAEQDRLAAIAKAEADRLAAIEEANKPQPVAQETSTAVVQPVVNNETTTSVVAIVNTETSTASSYAPTNTTQTSTTTQSVQNSSPVSETTTVVVAQTTITEVPTISSVKTIATQLSDVIWVLKNQIILMQKLYAKILTRTKGIK